MGNAGGYRQSEEGQLHVQRWECVFEQWWSTAPRHEEFLLCRRPYWRKNVRIRKLAYEHGHAHLELHQLEGALDLLLELLVVLLLIRSLRRHVPKDFTATRRCR
jgi:hypothetical protein